MGRGVSSGGGQSSLGYLFGSGESPKPAKASSPPTAAPVETETVHPAPQLADITKQIPAGINSTSSNNYMRADGQNTGNFLTVKIIPQITTALCSFLSDMVECS
ncbi:unnamed protein product [Linum tenue]|uniref:Protein SPIRAL1-like 1 n=1 Tax=Linum tenue TaxID=586396 RepID=A0AAV0NWP1_9ROSI|nr:unnamed protein product [Linum tenue]